ncbi:tissue-type plasminogen activator-like [Nerophis lumbriciformis]|uniref:tissue-type plasminogen activator-like n=2 Tax=Nerophis lumbriciformis TaxID=546530 RepID=UPI003BAA78A2
MPFAARLLLLMSAGVLSVQGDLMTVLFQGIMDGIDLVKTIPDHLIHKSTSPCDPNPCQRGGFCVSSSNQVPICTCPAGYKGRFCQIPPTDCYEGKGQSYQGVVSTTERGEDCLNWYSIDIWLHRESAFDTHLTSSVLDDNNHCRNPDEEDKPWCYVKRHGKLEWDYCNVTKCHQAPTGCYEGKGHSYQGVVSTTERGEDCLNWYSVHISLQQERGFHTYYNSSILDDLNHCRNPDKEDEPWCYVKRNGQLDWGYCYVKKCHQEHLILTPPPKVSRDSPPFSQCGVSHPLTLPRIYGGSKAAPSAHPWQASVQARRDNSQQDFRHRCGGSLIASCWVLTAAHCINNQFEYQVQLGGVKLSEAEDKGQIIPVIKTIVYNGYRSTAEALYSDIALLRLKFMDRDQCAKETRVVRTVCLPNQNFPTGKKCVVSGWGRNEDAPYSNHLLDVVVSLISQQSCRDPAVYGNLLDSTMLCAGDLHGGKDSSEGDSGGPLVCQHDGVHYLAGVVSWGHGYAHSHKPGVYVNVYSFVDWIKQHIDTPYTTT